MQVTDHASQLCPSALECSALLSPDFYCDLTMAFLVYVGVFVGFVFPNSECKQDANESKTPCTCIPGETEKISNPSIQ